MLKFESFLINSCFLESFLFIFVPYEKTNKTMRKNMTKRSYYNTGILIALNKKHGYSIDYIRKSLRNDRTGIIPDVLKKEYKALEKEAVELQKESQQKLEHKANNLNNKS
jgi:hypothetical protein